MDFGGISIFQFIKEKVFPKLLSYKREKLEKKDAGVLDGLKQVILETGMTVEQEKLVEVR